ncbi:DegT/DnrJ/EryC1/StrS aminotransferase family protein [Polynucleobacter sp. AP-Ainpum-60-G11]|uniref:DegT/DnrJ/EryC1/StrS family aminotransferase n=1 Tax=Polynucleobacter sp. AP-Ainpum-60-G11 TaxID=2576926 RepID=UPI001BFD511E|nr:DegT/DnrJ/EryC1/StrS family aminotransferase [Polynucleobacter sp. AP-Ainpum-60-G11]QWE27000.1 DegT/DnrJ/EryC1/StrS family aminotransferase [Polynucleobacter sp. AP-Ainpum-60-G11]
MPGYELMGIEEQREVNEVFDSGGVLFRQGFDALRGGCFKVKEFEEKFAEKLSTNFALAVTSGTAALRIALATIGLKPGDEVITQSFTFVATVEAIIEAGGTPICAEIDDTLNMDPANLRKKITSRTKAVIVVHMLGTPARIIEINKICNECGLSLIEDTAWGCGGSVSGKALGTWGRMGTFSFDFAKTITTGEGGMIVFKNNDDYLAASAWHDHGHENNPMVPRWEDTRKSSGFNYRMMELQGAVGLAQLKKLDSILKFHKENYYKIYEKIKNIKGITFRTVPDNSIQTHDALIFFVENSEIAKKCRKEFLNIGCSTKILPEAISWHFAGEWSHMQELVGACQGDLANAYPASKDLLLRAVALPINIKMDSNYPEKISKALKKIFT